ncbi:DUF4232 domain-containing protein [Catenulispora rubra]|uniref:DUF4232 domain-containing protein n=1 Tax=Catenulispora rubra TaxID=280293 RepID=UPI00189226CF|nr:DUF4232 domain-containing protein [Catenulispora rubra]
MQRSHQNIRTLTFFAVGTALVAVLAGCSSSSAKGGAAPGSSGTGGGVSTQTPAPTTTSTPTSSTSATSSSASSSGTSTAGRAPSGASSSTSAARATACTPSDVAISLGHTGAASGHVGGPLLFTNHGSRTCELTGYPRVQAAGGLTAEIQQTPDGYIGGLATMSANPPTVELAPGQVASAVVEGSDVPIPATAHCSTVLGSLDLWLPGNANSGAPTVISNPAGTCAAIQIHPVVPGTTGRQGQ